MEQRNVANWNRPVNVAAPTSNSQLYPVQNQFTGQIMYVPYEQYVQMMNQSQTPVQQPSQNQQQRPQQTMLRGRFVNSPDEIKPGEIDMYGDPSFFPTPDGSRIYARYWGKDGLIVPLTYVLEQPVQQEAPPPVTNGPEMAEIMSYLKTLDKNVKALTKQLKSKEETTNE